VQQSFSRDIQVPIQSEACYLVTGGLGDLGLTLTTWLAEKGAKSIILTGRRPLSDDILSQIEALGLEDCEIHYKMMDLASSSSCEQLIQGLTEDSYPLKGVFHLAGVTQDRKSIDLEWQDVEVVMTPKIRGLEHLVQSLDMELLDLLVVYSSASSLLGTAGQANYAMANAYMDAYVEQLAAKGLPAYSINWGPWDRGLAANYTRVFKTQGIEAMIPELAMNTLSLVLSQSTSRQVLIMKANWTTYTQVNGVQEQLKQLITNENSEESTPTSSNFSQKVANLGVEERYVELEKLIKIEIGQLLHIKNMSTVSNRKRLFEIGLDSLGAVDLKNKLASSLGAKLRGTLLFDFPTIEDLVQHIGHDVFKWQESQEPGDSEKSRDILSDDLSEDDLAALLMKELGDE
jgi:NADP-dependent 3-hydroxy acid dehydrogenase YdfG/acyl carrier protein